MNRYIITSPRFTGHAELIYDQTGKLIKIDCSLANMEPAIMKHFKSAVPVEEFNLKHSFTSETTIVHSKYRVTFEEFWKKYNYKFNRLRTEKLWNGLSGNDQVNAFFELDKYHRFLSKNPGHFKLHPDTYLRNRSWENEYK